MLKENKIEVPNGGLGRTKPSRSILKSKTSKDRRPKSVGLRPSVSFATEDRVKFFSPVKYHDPDVNYFPFSSRSAYFFLVLVILWYYFKKIKRIKQRLGL